MEQNKETYNGWTNYETWNIALWLQNEEILYNWMLVYIEMNEDPSYVDFIKSSHFENSCLEVRHENLVQLNTEQTPDGVDWLGEEVNTEEIDGIFSEIAKEGIRTF